MARFVTCRKNARKVADLVGVPERTVRDWKDRHGWEEERTRRLAALVPNLAAGVIEDTVIALCNSARYARIASELPADDGVAPSKERTDLAKLSLQLADALAGEKGLAGLLAGMRGDRDAPLAGVGAAADDELTDEEIDAMTYEEAQAWLQRTKR